MIMYTSMHIYIYTHTHTYIHMYTYTHCNSRGAFEVEAGHD